jgi:hypothetical protein
MYSSECTQKSCAESRLTSVLLEIAPLGAIYRWSAVSGGEFCDRFDVVRYPSTIRKPRFGIVERRGEHSGGCTPARSGSTTDCVCPHVVDRILSGFQIPLGANHRNLSTSIKSSMEKSTREYRIAWPSLDAVRPRNTLPRFPATVVVLRVVKSKNCSLVSPRGRSV